MKDIINSFKAHLYERTSSPLIGAFIFYWIICNYKLIMIIFDGEMKLNEKFDLIKTIYPQEKITLWNGFDIYYQILFGNGLLIPLIITLIYILLLPFASNYIYSLWIKHQNKLKEISNERVLTKKEFGDLQRRFTELELSFDDTFSKKDNEITQLKKLLDEKEHLLLESLNKIDEYKKDTTNTEELIQENNKLKDELKTKLKQNTLLQTEINKTYKNSSVEERKIMEYFSDDYRKCLNLKQIAQLLDLPELKVEYILNNLAKKSLIENTYYNGSHAYKLSQQGKNYLVENGLI
ncbi:hypothetical protein AB0W31_04770 [Aliarcobacter butzleri]|uniref:hypothetical protein n=1 Tax=Aliarcobacter butzleri TaxID=28197 RepID=UPI0028756375|nr:hypothetical protein [Aliarcobacter butzleri]MDS1370242.1 hypothetical protein [Aliarcobacter butzleri]